MIRLRDLVKYLDLGWGQYFESLRPLELAEVDSWEEEAAVAVVVVVLSCKR